MSSDEDFDSTPNVRQPTSNVRPYMFEPLAGPGTMNSDSDDDFQHSESSQAIQLIESIERSQSADGLRTQDASRESSGEAMEWFVNLILMLSAVIKMSRNAVPAHFEMTLCVAA